jgi:hypothetical protein
MWGEGTCGCAGGGAVGGGLKLWVWRPDIGAGGGVKLWVWRPDICAVGGVKLWVWRPDIGAAAHEEGMQW